MKSDQEVLVHAVSSYAHMLDQMPVQHNVPIDLAFCEDVSDVLVGFAHSGQSSIIPKSYHIQNTPYSRGLSLPCKTRFRE